MTALPTTVEELWGVCFIATTDEEAQVQAERQIEPFIGKVIRVDRIAGWADEDGDTGDPIDLIGLDPQPEVRVLGMETDGGWDGEVLYPQWDVEPINPDLVVTAHDQSVRLGDLKWPTYGAPGIGTAEGFTNQDESKFIFPPPVEPTP